MMPEKIIIPLKMIWFNPRLAIRYLLATAIEQRTIWLLFLLMVTADLLGNIIEFQMYLMTVSMSLTSLPPWLAPLYKKGLLLLSSYLCIYFVFGGVLLWVTSNVTGRWARSTTALKEIFSVLLWSAIVPLAIFSILDALLFWLGPVWIFTGLCHLAILTAALIEFGRSRNWYAAVLMAVITLQFSLMRLGIKVHLLSSHFILD